MGDWRKNKDEEVELDGIGGVNIIVKADVHRTGMFYVLFFNPWIFRRDLISNRYQLSRLCLRKPSRNRRLRSYGEACRVQGVRVAKLRGLAY